MQASEQSPARSSPLALQGFDDVTKACSMFCQVCDKGQRDLGSQPSLSTLISKTDVPATQSWAPEGIQ